MLILTSLQVSEPHFIASRGSSGGQGRPNEVLITVSLLCPEARQQVSMMVELSNCKVNFVNLQIALHDTAPLSGAPRIFTQPQQRGNDDTTVTTFGGNSSSSSSSDANAALSRHEYLSPLDVARLAWGVERVRTILAAPPLQGATREVSPGEHITSEENALDEWV